MNPHPEYVRRITPADDGLPAGRDDNGKMAEEGTGWLPSSARWLTEFFWQSEDRPVVSRASRAADAAIAAVAVIAAVIAVILQVRHQGGVFGAFSAKPGARPVVIGPPFPPPPWPSPWTFLGAVAIAAPLAFRRTYPITAFCVIMVAVLGASGHITSITVAAVIFAAYSAVAYSPYRRAALLSVLAGAVIVTVAYPNTTPPVPERYTALLILLPTVSVAMAIRVWRRRAGESAERLRLAEEGHEAETRRAVALERARIASEMHDVVTHNVSVMVVQAGAARRVLDSSPGDAREALLAVEASGRTAMTELRNLLGLLAPSGEAEPGPDEMAASGEVAGAPMAAGAGDAALTPQPGVARIPALVVRVCETGMPVELSVEAPGGTPRALSPGVDLAAYRVVQEGLTNVMKHAGQARTAVRLEYRPRDLVITVSDSGPPAAAGLGPAPGSGSVSGGRGLIGLRERIAVYGGELDAGPRPGGGWRLTARIPVEPSAGDLPVPPEFEEASR
jgi:signal transduction histidine kinase